MNIRGTVFCCGSFFLLQQKYLSECQASCGRCNGTRLLQTKESDMRSATDICFVLNLRPDTRAWPCDRFLSALIYGIS